MIVSDANNYIAQQCGIIIGDIVKKVDMQIALERLPDATMGRQQIL